MSSLIPRVHNMTGYYFRINEIRESIYSPGSGRLGEPPYAPGAYVVVGEGASNMWWLCDGKQIGQVHGPLANSVWYSTYSVIFREGFGFWVMRGDAGNPTPGETWQPLCFDQDSYDAGSSWLCNAAQHQTVLYRRETPWLPMLLPDIYYKNVPATTHPLYGGLKGELPIFLALVAFSMRPEILPGQLPVMFQNGSWLTHTQPNGWQNKRGVTVTVCTLSGQKREHLSYYERMLKYFN